MVTSLYVLHDKDHGYMISNLYGRPHFSLFIDDARIYRKRQAASYSKNYTEQNSKMKCNFDIIQVKIERYEE